MIIKRYLVNSMNEAMTRIRYELGKDAVIISQRKIRKPGVKGFFSKKVIEVTAAVENVKKTEENNVQSSIEAIKKVLAKEELSEIKPQIKSQVQREQNKEEKPKEEMLVEEKVEAPSNEANAELVKEMQEMKNMINSMVSNAPVKAARKTKVQTKLESNDLSEKVVKKILAKVKTVEENVDEMAKVKIVIEKMINITKPKLQGRIVLVGPTGVGKTTTIAKLAGRIALIEKKKVGLITIDTYRIGAVEQLKTYADIMNIPFKVVLTLKDMEAALESMEDCDVILIDTTGRSSKNTMQISELRAYVDKVKSDNIHLVISCTTKNKDIEAVVEGYKVLNYKNVIITKLDETSTYGSILNILDSAKKPLSFVTTGQNVPDDIKQMTASEISNLILGEDSIC